MGMNHKDKMRKEYQTSIILCLVYCVVLLVALVGFYKWPGKEARTMARYKHQTVSWYGDSLTQQYAFCENVDSYFGFEGRNCGINNTTITYMGGDSLCSMERMQNGEDYELNPQSEMIFIMAGVNDWMNSIPVDTFSDAVNEMFRNLKTNYSDARIIVLGTPFVTGKHYDRFKDTDGLVNKVGLTSVEYGDIFCEIATQWGIANINIGRCLDWDENNIFDKSPDGIHFSEDIGAKEVSDVVIDFLLHLQ